MPLYDFKCPKCGQVKEVQMGMKDIGVVKVNCVFIPNGGEPEVCAEMERVWAGNYGFNMNNTIGAQMDRNKVDEGYFIENRDRKFKPE